MRRFAPALAGLLLLAACSDDRAPTGVDDLPAPPAASAISDGANGGNPDFFFLPPLVKNPSITGTFNPDLAPEVEVCHLVGDDCGDPATIVAYFGPGEAQVRESHYQVNWKTNDPRQNLMPLDEDEDYRIRVRLGEEILGYLDVDPRGRGGKPAKRPGMYSFRLGRTIPIKFRH